MLPMVIWDIDGTLLRDNGSREDLFSQVIGKKRDMDIPKAGRTDRAIMVACMREVSVAEDKVSEYLDRLNEISVNYYSSYSYSQTPGAQDFLRYVKSSGMSNVLLTGNTVERAKIKLVSGGIDLDLFDWGMSQFGADSIDRNDLALGLLEESQNRCDIRVLFGDTDLDEAAARTLKTRFIRVCEDCGAVEEDAKVRCIPDFLRMRALVEATGQDFNLFLLEK